MRTELYWIDGPWPGRLAIMPRPRGGDWLEDEIQSWRRAGVDAVLSLLTSDEVADLALSEEERLCQENGIRYFSFPIPDRGIPSSKDSISRLLTQLGELLSEGKKIAVHCRQGIGRAAVVASGLLVLAGIEPEAAIERVSAARGCPVPETPEQRRWVAEYARSLLTRFPK